jgi:hypothetical protein
VGTELGARASWTDANVHDPGITVLEVLAYALTALAVAGGVVLVRRNRRRSADRDRDHA